MASLAFHWIVNWLLGWGGISLLVAIGCGAIWWFLPPMAVKARSLALHVGIGALAYNFAYSMGYQNGATTVRTEWKAAEQRAIESGRDARDQAEQEIEPAVDSPVVEDQPQSQPSPAPPGSVAPVPHRRPAAVPGWMRNDRNNRDNH